MNTMNIISLDLMGCTLFTFPKSINPEKMGPQLIVSTSNFFVVNFLLMGTLLRQRTPRFGSCRSSLI